jgi:hypothetical protein
MNWYISTTAMENVTDNITYVSYYTEEDDDIMEINLSELIEQSNTTITDYAGI